MEYYLVLKRNDLSGHERTWGRRKCTLLSERSQSVKAFPYCMIPTRWHFGKSKTIQIVK